MSPQIAPGHKMSPLHSAPHLSLLPIPLLFPLLLICLSFSFFFALLSIYSPLFHVHCSLPLCGLLLHSHPLTFLYFHLLKRAERGVFLTQCLSSLPFPHLYPPLIFTCVPSFLWSIHPTSISFCESWSFGQQLLFSQLFPLFLDIYQTPPVHPGVLYQIRDAILSNEAP